MGYDPVMAEPAARATTESDEQRARRLAWERARIAEADEDIAAAMTNLCRCGTYNAVADAIRKAAA